MNENKIMIGEIVIRHWMDPNGDNILTVETSDGMTVFEKIGMLEMAKPYVIEEPEDDHG